MTKRLAAELEGIRVEVPSNIPVMLIREIDDSRRVIPIYIGEAEASSISVALSGVVPDRPLTHDLMLNTISEMGGEVVMVVVTDVKEHTYFANIHIEVDGAERVISARPSDAIALAVRAEVPVFVESDLMDKVGKAAVTAEDSDEEEILDDFREFINSINPEDFQG
jgi:bifunctional DNase/RNase